jgi:hypothetical protein
MPPAGFRPAIPASERPQTHTLDRAATGIGFFYADGVKILGGRIHTLRNNRESLLVASREIFLFVCERAPQQKLRTHRSLKAYCATPLMKMKMSSFLPSFTSNGAPVE